MSLVSKRRIRRSGNTEMALSLEAMFLSSQSFSINSYYPSNTPLNDNPTSAISCNRWRSSTSPPILKRPSLINKLIEPDRPLITSGKQFSAQCLSITQVPRSCAKNDSVSVLVKPYTGRHSLVSSQMSMTESKCAYRSSDGLLRRREESSKVYVPRIWKALKKSHVYKKKRMASDVEQLAVSGFQDVSWQ